MFVSEVRVNGDYYKGVIKLWNGNYQFYEEPYDIDPSDRVWESESLRNMAKELIEIANKIVSLNTPDKVYREKYNT